MATIREIAALAGVSRGTVDRVLNRRGAVSPETEKKILEIARAVRYTPNRAGIVLAAQKKNLRLGLIVFGQGNPFFDKVLDGAAKKAEELSCYNCNILTRRVGVDTDEMVRAVDALVEEGIHGLAIAPGNDDSMRHKIDALSERGIPVVTLNTDIEYCSRLAYVGSDYYEGGRTAAGLVHLVTAPAGAPVHVGIISGSSQILCHTRRIAGFRERILECYPQISVSTIVYNHDDDIESYRLTAALLASHPEINALYLGSAGVEGACRALMASGRQESIRVISHDAIAATEQLLRDGLIAATICQQPEKQGALPLELLFSYLTTGVRPESDCYYLDSDIRIRENI